MIVWIIHYYIVIWQACQLNRVDIFIFLRGLGEDKRQNGDARLLWHLFDGAIRLKLPVSIHFGTAETAPRGFPRSGGSIPFFCFLVGHFVAVGSKDFCYAAGCIIRGVGNKGTVCTAADIV